METYIQSFSNRQFKTIKGFTHPQYSIDCFREDEIEFREKYWKIEPEHIVFDIGASYGAYTLAAGVMGAAVYAFEPEKTIYCDLVNNIRLNDWAWRIFAFNTGMWNTRAVINMESYAPHWPQGTISGGYLMDTIDEVAEAHLIPRLDWVKIDVEGAEENVIRGGLMAIGKLTPNLIVECHTFLDPNITENVKKLLLSVGDYKFEEVDRDPCIMLVAKAK